jgi:hypothetical protein
MSIATVAIGHLPSRQRERLRIRADRLEQSDSELKLPLAKPAVEIGPVHDSENEDDVVLLDEVVHHAIIAYAQSVE